MGKSIKKILKVVESKNGKNKGREGQMEKSKFKNRPKLRSFWSKWSSLFNRTSSSSRLPRAKTSTSRLSQAPQIPPIVMNNPPKDMELWGHDESFDVNSQMLNIPMEPGRQVSTIVLSPTKTGFKAVITHYDVNSSLRRSLTKDFKTVSEQIENRRALTLVFDMNQRTFEEIGVGKSECRVRDEGQDEDGEENRNISASALYVRNDADELVESAAFLQAQLSFDDTALTESSLFISEEKSINLERRHVSCRSVEKSRVAFKTISEPMWQEKEKMRKEMIIKQNVQEMLNQFIFLEQDDSLMNYPRVCEEELSNEEKSREEKVRPEVTEERESGDERGLNNGAYFLPGKFSLINANSTRNVAPNMLVNIKPFKQYIGNYSRLEVQPEKLVSKKVEIMTKKTEKDAVRSRGRMPQVGLRKISEERAHKSEVKFEKVNTKSRLSLCIKCGTEVRGDEGKKMSRENGLHLGKNIYKTSRHNSVATQNVKTRSSMVSTPTSRENLPCTLCSVTKMYKKKSSFTSISHIADSLDDILREFESYDHDLTFRQNISNFRTKIDSHSPSIEFKKSHSSLSFAEVIELEEGKISLVRNQKAMVEDSKADDMQKVTVRLIEFVRKNDGKTVELQRIKTATGHLRLEKIALEHKVRITRLENSSLVFTFRECNKIIRIMAQKIEENMLKSVSNANELRISEASTTVVFPAHINWARISNFSMPRRHSENRLEEFRRNVTNYKRTGQIPDVINQLLSNKVDDLRNELISRLNETKMSYNSDSYHSVQLADVDQQEESDSKCSASIATCSGEGSEGDENVQDRTENGGEEHEKGSDEGESEQPIGQNPEEIVGANEEEPKERSEFLEPQLLSDSLVSNRSSSSTSRKSEMNMGENVEKTEEEFRVADENSSQVPAQGEAEESVIEGLEELKKADANGPEKFLSFKTSSDYKAQACLMYFIPYVQQIQTAVEILYNVAYDFPIRKEEEGRAEEECVQIMRSYTLLSDKKEYLIDGGVESLVAKKCVEKNIIDGIETSKTSKTEITKIENSKSGNHLLVTNKRILTTNDRIRKSKIVGGGVEAESNSKILQGNHESVLMRSNLSEEGEDVNGIRFLYCNRSDGYGTCESSLASNFSYGLDQVRENSSSAVVINELGESVRACTDVRLNGPEEEIEGYCREKATDCENTNKVDDSLQEIDHGTGQIANDQMECEVVTLLQKAKDSVINSGELGRLGSASEETKNPSLLIEESKSSVTKKDPAKVKVTEEKLTIKKEELSKILLPHNIKTSGAKMVKKVGKGIVSQRIATKSSGSGGRELLIRREENEITKKKDAGNAERLSVVIKLSKKKNESERSSAAPGKYYTKDQKSRRMVKLSEFNGSQHGSRKSIETGQSDASKNKGGTNDAKSDPPYCIVQRRK